MAEQSRNAQQGQQPAQRRGRGGGGGGGGLDPDAWMVTFSDLLTLLMTFFVLIFASQDPQEERIQEAFGQRTGVFGLYRSSFVQDLAIVQQEDVSEDRLQVFLDEVGAVEIDVEQQDRGLVVTLPADAYFEPNSAALTDLARRRAGQLGELLQLSDHQVRVVGHTDDQETGGEEYDGPWALSVARANAVLQSLRANGVPDNRLSLTGYGPSEPRYTNLSREGRLRNRRVELVIRNRESEEASGQ